MSTMSRGRADSPELRLGRGQLRAQSGRGRGRAEDGIGLVLVLGVTSTLLIIMAITVVVATNSLSSARSHVNYEQSMAAAETGLETTLGEIQTERDAGDDFSSPPECTAGWGWPVGTVPTVAQERAWALAAIESMPASCVGEAGEGEYIAFRARDNLEQNTQVVYSMGWAPERSLDRSRSRLIRANYVFSPYQPIYAVLANPELRMSGDVNITGSVLGDSDVRTNGNFVGDNNIRVNGDITAAGTNNVTSCPNSQIDGVCQSGESRMFVPTVSAYGAYRSLASGLLGTWRDLCPDGTVRAPDPARTAPCTGDVISATSSYNGWSLSTVLGVPTWTYAGAGSAGSWIYYAYRGDIVLNPGNAETATMTVIAEADARTGVCSKSGGNIEWRSGSVVGSVSGLVMLADATLSGTSTGNASTGAMAAGDTIQLTNSTSNPMGISGSLLASGSCPTADFSRLTGPVTLTFDATSDVPVSSVIRTTDWLELSGGL